MIDYWSSHCQRHLAMGWDAPAPEWARDLLSTRLLVIDTTISMCLCEEEPVIGQERERESICEVEPVVERRTRLLKIAGVPVFGTLDLLLLVRRNVNRGRRRWNLGNWKQESRKLSSEPGPVLKPTWCLEEVEYIARPAASGHCGRHYTPPFPTTALLLHCADCLKATGKGAEVGPKWAVFPKQLQKALIEDHTKDPRHSVGWISWRERRWQWSWTDGDLLVRVWLGEYEWLVVGVAYWRTLVC
jgi:hypothetical protein